VGAEAAVEVEVVGIAVEGTGTGAEDPAEVGTEGARWVEG